MTESDSATCIFLLDDLWIKNGFLYSFFLESIKSKIDQNKSAFVIGIVGAVITLAAYSQTLMSPTQFITVGLLDLVFGLLVRKGLINI